MTTASIDIDTLDKLFDNQKKLDDIFDSIFDDDSFNTVLASEDELESSVGMKPYSEEVIPTYNEEKIFVQNKRGIIHLLLPVIIEIATIYYLVEYFS